MARSAAVRTSRSQSAVAVAERPTAPPAAKPDLQLYNKNRRPGAAPARTASSRIVEDVAEQIWHTYRRTRDTSEVVMIVAMNQNAILIPSGRSMMLSIVV